MNFGVISMSNQLVVGSDATFKARFGGYCFVFGLLVGSLHLAWGVLLASKGAPSAHAAAYILWALLPFTVAFLGWSILRHKQRYDVSAAVLLKGAFVIALIADLIYINLAEGSLFHAFRNAFLTAWYPLLGWLWIDEPFRQSVPSRWDRVVGAYILMWAVIHTLFFGARLSSMMLFPIIGWALLGLGIVGFLMGLELLSTGLVRFETIVIGGGLGAVALIAMNLYWIAYLWMRFTGNGDADWMLFYLIGGLADIGYITAPLVWVLTMFWGVATEDS